MKLQEAWDASEGRGVRHRYLGEWKEYKPGDALMLGDAVSFATWEPIPAPPRDWCDEVASTAWVRGLVASLRAVDKLAKLIRDEDKQACKFYEYRAKEESKPAEPDLNAALRVLALLEGAVRNIGVGEILKALKGE